MAYAESRSMNADLAAGMADGSFKRVNNDRGGVVEGATARQRSDLDDQWYGIHEKNEKHLPDTSIHTTPFYAPTSVVNHDLF